MFRMIIIAVMSLFLLSACATSKRGAKQEFLIKTTPAGAKVETNIPAKKYPRYTAADIEKIKSGVTPEPTLDFLLCESSPCSFQLPRKIEFDVLISKDGYASEVHKIDHFHRKDIAKEIKKEVARNTAIVGTSTAVAGTVVVASMVNTLSLGTASASSGLLATSAAVLAAPALGVGLISMGIDSSTGANYDYWPNPVTADLQAADNTVVESNAKIYEAFDQKRRGRLLRAYPTRAQAAAERKAIAKDRKDRLENNRLFKDYVANPQPEREARPQSERAKRRADKQRYKAEKRAAKTSHKAETDSIND